MNTRLSTFFMRYHRAIFPGLNGFVDQRFIGERQVPPMCDVYRLFRFHGEQFCATIKKFLHKIVC
jgi:hypothetical protein